jgi:PAS domain S-box-containing protein
MGADAWSGWAGTTHKTPPGMPSIPVGPPELDELPELIVAWAARLVGTRDALLWLVEEDGHRLVVRCGTGRFSTSVGRSLRKGEGLAGEVWQTGTPLAVMERHPLRRLREPSWQDAAGAALCVPLLGGESVIGVLGVAWSELGRVVGAAETELLRGFAELAGAAIDNAGRLAAARRELASQAQAQGWLPGADERYRALSEQIPAVLYSEVHAVGGSFVYKSPQNEDMLGYSSEEAMQPGFWKTLLHPDDRERVLAEDERCERTGDPWHVEYRVFAKDGRVLWLRDHAVLVRGKNGEPDLWQGFYIDVTDQKRAEAVMREALQRERQAARQLRALDEMKNTFLDAVSHELRTPLAAVIGIALTLKRAGSSLAEEDTADLLDRLVVNADKLDRLLSDLLDLDRLSKGIVEPQLSSIDLAVLVARIAEEWRQRSGRQLDLEIEPVIAWVDAAKVERIVENLLATLSGTPCRIRQCGSRSPARTGVCCWRSRTPAAGCRTSCGRPCSSRSVRDPGRPVMHRGWASASRWWPASPNCMAGGRGSRPGPAVDRRSASSSPTTPTRVVRALATPDNRCWSLPGPAIHRRVDRRSSISGARRRGGAGARGRWGPHGAPRPAVSSPAGRSSRSRRIVC